MELPKITCEKCGHTWVPRVPDPVKCSRCGHIIGTNVYGKSEEQICQVNSTK